uniref:Uncharacterized protein n=1 Tax=viral metagenome TaxID=1070528 RepID=A0A6H1ZT93_9ZZZZ
MRSAALAYLLKLKGHDAIAVGMRCMGRDTRKMMLDWAEKIIVLHEKCQEGVAQEYWDKLNIWEVGPDVYRKKYHANLIFMLEANIKREGL